MAFIDRLSNYLRAGYPAIVVNSSEEQRVLGDVVAAAKQAKRNVATWSAVQGLRVVSPQPAEISDTQDLLAACMRLVQAPLVDTCLVLLDAGSFPLDRDPILSRHLHDVIVGGPANGSSVLFLGANFKPIPAIEALCTVLEYSLPDREALAKIAKGIAESAGKPLVADDAILAALGGLSTSEAENALALSLVEEGSFDASIIYREKIQAVKRSGLLEITEPDKRGLEAIGGFAALKGWILKRKRAFSKEARDFGLPAPKGVLLVGVPGTGKSLAAKAVGTALGVPTLKLDIGALFGSLVGESEQRARDALKLAEAVAPCVLWLDEIDKGLAGSIGNGANDGGTTKRVFGTILQWLQERSAPVFLVATANDVSALPPEFYRRGRWDEIWSVDLPVASERAEILQVAAAKYNRKLGKVLCDSLAGEFDRFTGAEIEATIVAALYDCFDAGKDLDADALADARKAIVPLAEMARDRVEAIRDWAKRNARNVSGEVSVPVSSIGVRKLASAN